MPRYGRRSKARLAGAHTDLQKVFNKVIKIYDCSIMVSHRGEIRQTDMFVSGRSQLKWPKSKHNSTPSRAVDAVPYPIDWADRDKAKARFYYMAGIVKAVAHDLKVRIRWGGDWDSDMDFDDQTFDDLPHFELR